MQRILSQHFSPDDIASSWSWTPLLAEDRKSLGRKKLFQGHFYGPLERLIGRECFCFTILRDPIERALSHYGHVVSDTNHYLHRRALELGSFPAYLEDPITRMTVSNFQARMLAMNVDVAAMFEDLTQEERSGWYLERHIETTDFGFENNEILAAAQERLSKCDVVGLTERFAETLALLCYKCGWPYPSEIQHHNVNKNRPRQFQLSPDILQRLVELNETDIALYHIACNVFEGDFHQILAEMISSRCRTGIWRTLLGQKRG